MAIRHKLALRDALQAAFLRSASERSAKRSSHPYAKFRISNVVIRSLDDRVYPEIDETPGISSWFRLEPFDFYHNGLEVILNLRHGVIDSAGRWDFVEYGVEVDAELFREIKVWVIGQIPFHFIRAYDLDGDEHYRDPHLYCLYGDHGQPYEAIRYAICTDGDEYDWPLDISKRVAGLMGDGGDT